MKTIISGALFLASLSTGAFAQSNGNDKPLISGNISGLGQARYFQPNDLKHLAQYNLTLKASVDINGFVTIHSMVQSGNRYDVGFNTAYNTGTGQFNSTGHNLYLKRFYLEKTLLNDKLTIQAGAMATRSSIAVTNKYSNIGWIDGARAQLDTKVGKIMITAGQIQSGEANLIDRAKNADFNYFEIAISSKVMEKLLIEGGVEVFDDKAFFEVATNYDIEIAANRILKLVGDAKVQADNGAVKFGAGVQDVLSLIQGKDSRVKLGVNYEYVHSNYASSMHALSNGMHMDYTGGAVVVESSFPISEKRGITGFTNLRVGNEASDFRIEAGVKVRLFNKKFKTRR